MIRKFTIYLLFCSSWMYLAGCNEDDVNAPPKTSFTVNASTGDANETSFTFEVNQVDADAISLLPYGTENPSLGGILINPSEFENGVARVEFTYAEVGSFNAVVVTNNHSGDGEVANTFSDPIVMTIGSNKSELTEFTFEKSTKTVKDGNTFTVTVPYGTDLTTLKGQFKASPFSTVSVGGTTQESGKAVNNFTNPITYRVTSNRGTFTDYVVQVIVTPIETLNTIKSITAKAARKSIKDRVFGTYIDNDARRIVVYDTLGTPTERFDSVRIGYALDGSFAVAKYNENKLKQDSLLNLTTVKQIEVRGQDSLTSGSAMYNIYTAQAPLLRLRYEGTPVVFGTTENFDIKLTVLKGTNLSNLILSYDGAIELPAGVTVTGIMAYEDGSDTGKVFTEGVTPLNYSKPVRLELTVNDANLGFSYKVNYTVTVTVVP